MLLKRRYSRLHNKRILIMINGWGCPTWLFRFIKNILPKNCGYLEYHYDKKEICSEPKFLQDKITRIVNRIKKDVKTLNKFKEREFFMYTLSLGSIMGMIVADCVKIKKAAMIIPIHDLAEVFWNLKRDDTKEVKQYFVRNKFDLVKLKKLWSPFSFNNWFKKNSLKTKFLFRLAEKDDILKPNFKKKFFLLMKKRKVNFVVQEKKTTHKWFGFFNIVFPKKTIKFLLS